MDESTLEQWMVIGAETAPTRAGSPTASSAMLESLGDITDGFATDQLTHCLQTATLAERAGAEPEVVFASLCHDIGKAVSVPNHPAIAAEILRPYVSDDVYDMIRAHQDFQGRHYYAHFGGDPDAREQYEGEPWFDLTARFADEWDQVAFDPDYDTLPLEHFEPLVREMTASARISRPLSRVRRGRALVAARPAVRAVRRDGRSTQRRGRRQCQRGDGAHAVALAPRALPARPAPRPVRRDRRSPTSTTRPATARPRSSPTTTSTRTAWSASSPSSSPRRARAGPSCGRGGRAGDFAVSSSPRRGPPLDGHRRLCRPRALAARPGSRSRRLRPTVCAALYLELLPRIASGGPSRAPAGRCGPTRTPSSTPTWRCSRRAR